VADKLESSFHTFEGTYIISRLFHTIFFVGHLIISLFFRRIAYKTKTLVRHSKVVIHKKKPVYILLILKTVETNTLTYRLVVGII